ncbi:MAG: hypothetical protein ABEJ28_02640 [Salinigranum sp.]
MSENTTALEARLSAVERAVSGGETDLADVADAATIERRVSELESTVERIDERVAELDAAVQAVRGFAGGIRAVDRAVERRADLALAKAEAIEAELGGDAALSVDRVRLDDRNADRASPTGDRDVPSSADERDPEGATAPDAPEAPGTFACPAQTDPPESADAQPDSGVARVGSGSTRPDSGVALSDSGSALSDSGSARPDDDRSALVDRLGDLL